MPRTRPRYPKETREEIVRLVRSGRSPADLAREFEPTSQTIRNWVTRDDLEAGRRAGSPTIDERDEELHRVRREARRLREERDILAKAAAWFAQETDRQGSTGS